MSKCGEIEAPWLFKLLKETFNMALGKLVLVKDLKPSPANRELYDDFNAKDPKMMKLVEQMKAHYQQTKKNGNYEVIVIDKNNSIRSGDRRTYASKLAGIKHILAIVCDDEYAYDENRPLFREMELLAEYNDSKLSARDEASFITATRKFNKLKLAKEDYNGAPLGVKEYNAYRKAFALKLGIDPAKFSKAMTVFDTDRIDLLIRVDLNEISIDKAYNEATGREMKLLNVDPNRPKWVKIFKENPAMQEDMINYAISIIRYEIQGCKIETRLKKLQVNPITDYKFGIEKQMKSTIVSNAFMSAIALALVDHGYTAETAGAEFGGVADTRIFADENGVLYFSETNGGYYTPSIEVKASYLNPNQGSENFFVGSIGATTSRFHDQDFLYVQFDDDMKRFSVLLSECTRKDWQSNGSSQAAMRMSTWYTNHYENEDEWLLLKGDIFTSNRKVNVQLEKI